MILGSIGALELCSVSIQFLGPVGGNITTRCILALELGLILSLAVLPLELSLELGLIVLKVLVMLFFMVGVLRMRGSDTRRIMKWLFG